MCIEHTKENLQMEENSIYRWIWPDSSLLCRDAGSPNTCDRRHAGIWHLFRWQQTTDYIYFYYCTVRAFHRRISTTLSPVFQPTETHRDPRKSMETADSENSIIIIIIIIITNLTCRKPKLQRHGTINSAQSTDHTNRILSVSWRQRWVTHW